ncbi:MAG TPA: tetratricopeptide repeat protein [Vicinamibacterales bacterium]
MGQLDLSIAEQKRLVRKKPGDSEAANRLADLYVRSGKDEEAVEFFSTLAETLFTRGRLAVAAAFYERVLRIRPGYARALIRCGEIATADRRFSDAHGYFAAAADRSLVEGDSDGAAAIRARIDSLDLTEIQERLTTARLRAHCGGELDLLGHSLRAAARTANSQDIQLRALLAKSFVERGDAAGAAEYVTAEMAGDDPALLLAIAEIQLRGGKLDEALTLVEQAVAEHAGLLSEAARLGADVGPHAPGLGFRLVELAVSRWAAESKWNDASAALEAFTARVPDYAPAKSRLTHVSAMANMTARLSALASKARSTILSFARPESTRQSPAGPAPCDHR